MLTHLRKLGCPGLCSFGTSLEVLPGLRPVGAPMLAMGRESSMAVEGARDVLGWVEVAKGRDAVTEK